MISLNPFKKKPDNPVFYYCPFEGWHVVSKLRDRGIIGKSYIIENDKGEKEYMKYVRIVVDLPHRLIGDSWEEKTNHYRWILEQTATFAECPYLCPVNEYDIQIKSDAQISNIYYRMPLYKTFDDKKYRSEMDIVNMGIELCHALIFLYDKDLFHNDLHLGNLLMTEDDHIMLTDYDFIDSKPYSDNNWENDINQVVAIITFLKPSISRYLQDLFRMIKEESITDPHVLLESLEKVRERIKL